MKYFRPRDYALAFYMTAALCVALSVIALLQGSPWRAAGIITGALMSGLVVALVLVWLTDNEPAEPPPTRAHDVGTQSAPHAWASLGGRIWLCRYCYAPRSLHPRTDWNPVRRSGDYTYLSKRASHFTEGW